MRDIWLIASSDVRYFLRERQALAWLFVMPLIFFYFIGTVTGGARVLSGRTGGDEDATPLVLRSEPGEGFLADELERRLSHRGFRVVRHTSGEGLPEAEVGGTSNLVLELPAGFTMSVLSGEPTTPVLSRTGPGTAAQWDQIRIGRALFQVSGSVAAAHARGEKPSLAAFHRLDQLPRPLEIDVLSVTEHTRIPRGFDQAVPGIMVMFTMLVLLTSGASFLVLERNRGLLSRLACTPLGRGRVVFGKWLGRMALAGVQIVFAMISGTVLFGVGWGPDLPMVLIALLGWAAFCASAGLLLGILCRTEAQAGAVGALVANVLAALGGCWWPIEITPEWVQDLAHWLPTGWAMESLHALVIFERGAASATGEIAVMLLGALALGWLSVRLFRYR